MLVAEHSIVTNAAGGLNSQYSVGDIAVLNDVSTIGIADEQLLTFASILTLQVSRECIPCEARMQTILVFAFRLCLMHMTSICVVWRTKRGGK